jgi:hypothetical protein
LNNNLVDAFFFCGRCAAESDLTAGLILQTECDFFEGMRHAGGLTGPCSLKGANGWKNAPQLLLEFIAWDHGPLLGLAAHNGLNAGLATP